MALKLIIDTDPGIDDAMAIFYAIAAPEIDLLGLTTVFGNVTTAKATRNALYLLEQAGIETPVAEGLHRPRVLPAFPPSSAVHGAEGLERSRFPCPGATRWLRQPPNIWCGWHGSIGGNWCFVPLVL
jgi:inosine-uridine nucleoside N-ribohydrolase